MPSDYKRSLGPVEGPLAIVISTRSSGINGFLEVLLTTEASHKDVWLEEDH